jgi:hypothetical protein
VVAEAMVMLVLARSVVEKFGGDSMGDLRANADAYRDRISRAPDAPVAGGPGSDDEPGDDDPAIASHGLTGTDEAGSGGDD